MEIIFIQPNPKLVDFFYKNAKIASVWNANVIFHPVSADICKDWKEQQWKEAAEFMAPFIAKMLP